jgi:hypothetical protein
MKKFICCLSVLLPIHFIYTQVAFPISSSVSVANTAVADIKNRTAFHNPATWSSCAQPQIVCSIENPYQISELASKSIMVLYPFQQFVSSLSFAHYGFSLYHEMILGAAFVRDFSGKFSMGMQFNYHTAYFASSNKYYGAVYPQIGLLIPLAQKIIFGFHVSNPFATGIKSEILTKHIPAVYSIGCSYSFSPEFIWRMQTDKEIRSTYRIATAFDYTMKKHYRFQAGVYIHECLVPCLGFGFDLKPFAFDLVTELHPLLGLNTIAQLQFNIHSKR